MTVNLPPETHSKLSLTYLILNFLININNNNNQDNVYGTVIMAEPLREFTRFS